MTWSNRKSILATLGGGENISINKHKVTGSKPIFKIKNYALISNYLKKEKNGKEGREGGRREQKPRGLERCFNGEEHFLLFRRTQVQFPEPKMLPYTCYGIYAHT